jgi:acyl-CoA thioesterase FadM
MGVPFGRFARVCYKSSKRKPIHFLDSSKISLRVWPNDIDINLHMNNSRYMAVLDLGRFDLIWRMGLMSKMRQEKWRPVVGSATIAFYKSLNAFQKFSIKTRLVYWDAKWFYLEQHMYRNGALVCHAYVKTLFLQNGKKVPTDKLLEAIDADMPCPQAPAALLKWCEAEQVRKRDAA